MSLLTLSFLLVSLLSRSTTLVSKSSSASAVTLLSDGELDTLALGQGNPRLLRADDEDVALAGSEGVVNSILDVDDVETTIVTLTVSDDTNTTHVATTSDHGNGTGIEPDEVKDLASLNVDLDGVVDLDSGVGVADARYHVSKPGGDFKTYQPYRSVLVSMADLLLSPRNGASEIIHVSTKAWSNG